MFLQTISDVLGSDPVFWFCALSGTGLFVVQLVLSVLGNSEFASDEIGEEMDSSKFKWLSKQAITGFLMMFGWTGLTCKKELHTPIALAVALAFTGGLVSVFILGYIFKIAKKLKSPGAVFQVEDAIGKEATVYHRIPKVGSGKITLSLHNLTYEIDAMSQNSEEIHSFTQVKITRKIDDKTVLVIPK